MEFITTVFIVLIVTSGSLCFDNDFICDKESSIDISEWSHLANGDIYFKGVTYKSNEYIVDNITRLARGCLCAREKCVRKCCPMGYGYHIRKKICVKVNDTFDPPIWDQYQHIPDAKTSELFRIFVNIVNCTGEYRARASIASEKYHLVNDGNLYLELPHNSPPWMIRPPDKYCLDTFVFQDPAAGDRTTRFDALICIVEEQYNNNYYILNITCMMISCLFILATLVVYGWLPELRNLHGRVLMVYLICFFGTFLCSATMQLLLYRDNISSECCQALTFVIYFCLLSAFFWLNVMSFDIWWTFSGKRGMTLEKMSARARFFAYFMYAFGVPTMLTILVAGLEYSDLPKNPFLPLIRHQGCFFVGNSKLIYLYGPMVLVILANLIFFVLTALKITQISRQTSVLESTDSSTHAQHRDVEQRLFLYVKLFILEVSSAIYPEFSEMSSYTDVYNVLIGVSVFIIFVCKRKIFRLIKKHFFKSAADISLTACSNADSASSGDENCIPLS